MFQVSARVQKAQLQRTNAKSDIDALLVRNNLFVQDVEKNPELAHLLQKNQTPAYLWLGCADSRAPPNMLVKAKPGEVFVHRNAGNQALPFDISLQATIEFAVNGLGVEHIIVCGHYQCGAVKAALTAKATDLDSNLNTWIDPIRQSRNNFEQELLALDEGDRWDRLCELNVLRQVHNICATPTIQKAWAKGNQVQVHGVIFSLEDGKLQKLTDPIFDVKESEIMDQEKDLTPSSTRIVRVKPDGSERANNPIVRFFLKRKDSGSYQLTDREPEGTQPYSDKEGLFQSLQSSDEGRAKEVTEELKRAIQKDVSWSSR